MLNIEMSLRSKTSHVSSSEEETAHQESRDINYNQASISSTINVVSNVTDVDQLVDRVCKELEISKKDQMKLKNLHINITWELPYIHTLERKRYSDMKTIAEMRQHLAKSGLKLMFKNRYTQEENTIIKKNWEEFSQVYGFNNPMLFFRSNVIKYLCKTEQYKFKLFLAKNIHTRLLQSVQDRFEELYGTLKRGRFSQDEDKLLLSLMKYDLTSRNIPQLKLISTILGRSKMSVTIRLKRILKGWVKTPEVFVQKRKSYEVDSQRLELIKILLKTAIQNLNTKNYEDLQYTSLPDAVFDEVGRKIRMPAIKVKRYWHDPLFAQLFAKCTLSRNMIRASLINLLSDPPYDMMQWENIPWTKVSHQLGDVGPFFAYRRIFEMVRRYVPYRKRTKFLKCVRHLKQNYLEALTTGRIKDIIMPKITYNSETDEVTVEKEGMKRLSV